MGNAQQNVRISIITCCYNAAQYLEEAINSILNQSFQNFELILIDDASLDNTLAICESYSQRDSRVKTISLPVNVGVAAARNAGIQIACGEWIAILDSDDVSMPDRLAEQIKVAESNRDIVLIGSNSVLIDKNGKHTKCYQYPTKNADLVRNLESIKKFPPHSSILYRKDAVRRALGFNTKFVQSEDWDLWLRLSKIGQLASVDKTLVKIRKHDNNISNSSDGMLQLTQGMMATICHFIRIRGFADPSDSGSIEDWQKFTGWVETQMQSRGIFEKRKFWIKNVMRYRAKNNRLLGLLDFMRAILTSGIGYRSIFDRLSGQKVARKLADKWIAEKK